MSEGHPEDILETPERHPRFSRRGFLTASSVSLATTGLATIGTAKEGGRNAHLGRAVRDDGCLPARRLQYS